MRLRSAIFTSLCLGVLAHGAPARADNRQLKLTPASSASERSEATFRLVD
jgi:hypothetical protein